MLHKPTYCIQQFVCIDNDMFMSDYVTFNDASMLSCANTSTPTANERLNNTNICFVTITSKMFYVMHGQHGMAL